MTLPSVVLSRDTARSVPDAVGARLAGGAGLAELAAALRALLDERGLHDWLAGLVADESRLARVAAVSYWHPNGFAKLVLHNGPGFRIRLHVWPAGSGRRGESDPHRHRWNFASAVLVGPGLLITEHVEAERGVPHIRCAYDGQDLAVERRVRLRAARSDIVSTREVYRTETDMIHTVLPRGDELVATLVLQGPHLAAATAVYGPNGGAQPNPRGLPIVVEDVRALVSEVVAAPDWKGAAVDDSDGSIDVDGSIRAVPADERRLSELGERRIVSELLVPRYRAVESYGDDCAVLGNDLVISTDSCSWALVASLQMDDPFYTGWLLATINLSDLAAAGAEPEGLVVNYVLPRDTTVGVLRHIMDGVDACAASHHTSVLGGDLSEGAELRLSATAVGRCGRRESPDGPVSTRLSRRGGRPGDHLLLVGSPGYLWGAALLHHGYARVPDAERDEVYRRARRPEAQLVAGRLLATHGLARAATDVSDGLCASVRNLCLANDLGALVSGRMLLDPVLETICAAVEIDSFELGQTWGDWCLLVAVAEHDVARAEGLLVAAGVGVRDIGTFTPQAGGIRLADGSAVWDGVDQQHFSATGWHGKDVKDWLELLVTRGRLTQPRESGCGRLRRPERRRPIGGRPQSSGDWAGPPLHEPAPEE